MIQSYCASYQFDSCQVSVCGPRFSFYTRGFGNQDNKYWPYDMVFLINNLEFIRDLFFFVFSTFDSNKIVATG